VRQEGQEEKISNGYKGLEEDEMKTSDGHCLDYSDGFSGTNMSKLIRLLTLNMCNLLKLFQKRRRRKKKLT
jgi:hypothetical protein